MLFLHQEGKQINLYVEHLRCFETKKELEKREDPKQVQGQSQFQDRTESWVWIVGGFDKFVR